MDRDWGHPAGRLLAAAPATHDSGYGERPSGRFLRTLTLATIAALVLLMSLASTSKAAELVNITGHWVFPNDTTNGSAPPCCNSLSDLVGNDSIQIIDTGGTLTVTDANAHIAGGYGTEDASGNVYIAFYTPADRSHAISLRGTVAADGTKMGGTCPGGGVPFAGCWMYSNGLPPTESGPWDAVPATPGCAGAGNQCPHRVSGTIYAQSCAQATCTQKGLQNIKVLVSGTSTGGARVSQIGVSAADGTWSVSVPSGTYTAAPTNDGATPADGFDPPTRAVLVGSVDVPNQDFTTCATPSGQAPDLTGRAAGPAKPSRCQATIAGFVTDSVQRLGGFQVTVQGTTTKGVAVNETLTSGTTSANLGFFKQKVDPGTYTVSIATPADGIPINFKLDACAGTVLSASGASPACKVTVSSGDALKTVNKLVNFTSDCVTKIDFKTSMIAEGCFKAMDNKGIKFRAQGRVRVNGVDLEASFERTDPLVFNTQRKRIDGTLVKLSLSARGFGSGWCAWLLQSVHESFPSVETSWGFRLQTPWGSWRNVGLVAANSGAGYLTPPKDGSLTLFGLPPVHALYLRLAMRGGTTSLAGQLSLPEFKNAYGEPIIPFLDHNGIWKARGRNGLTTVYPHIIAARVEADNAGGVSAIEFRGGPADAYLLPAKGFKLIPHKGAPPKVPNPAYRSIGAGNRFAAIELAQVRARWDLGKGFRLEGALVLHGKLDAKVEKLAGKFGGFLGSTVVIAGVDLAWRKIGGHTVLIPLRLSAEAKSMHIQLSPLFFWERLGIDGTFDLASRPPQLGLSAKTRFTFLPTFKHDFLWFQEAAAIEFAGGLNLKPTLGFCCGRATMFLADTPIINGTGAINSSGMQIEGSGGIDLSQLRFPLPLQVSGVGSFTAAGFDNWKLEFHGEGTLFSLTGHVDAVVNDTSIAGCWKGKGKLVGFYIYPLDRRLWRLGGCRTGVFGSAQKAGVQSNLPDSFGDKGAADRSGARPARRASDPIPAFVVGASSHVDAVAVRGRGAPPAVRLDGPNGLTAQVAPGQSAFSSDAVTMIENPDDATTYVYLNHSPSGTYTLTPLAGSAPITALDFAEPLPDPSVRATVSRAGCAQRLRWKLTSIPGQTVTFSESGSDGQQVLTSTNGASGSLTFTPRVGADAARTIVASVDQLGTPRGTFTLARYTAPTGLPPDRPSGLSAKRAGSRVLVSWAPVCAASGYVVIAGGGRADVKSNRATVPVGGRGPVTVSVQAYGPTQMLSLPASRRIR